jgi:hypothetical protein
MVNKLLEKSQNQELADHIKKNLAKGYTPDAVKYSLINQGYSRTTVEKALDMAQKQLAVSVPKIEEKPKITYEVVDSEEMKKKIAEQDGSGFWSGLKRKLFG